MQKHERIIHKVPTHRSTGAKIRRRYVSIALCAMLPLLLLGSSLAIVPDAAAATQERGKTGRTIFTFAALSFFWAGGGRTGLHPLELEVAPGDSVWIIINLDAGILKTMIGLLALALVQPWGRIVPTSCCEPAPGCWVWECLSAVVLGWFQTCCISQASSMIPQTGNGSSGISSSGTPGGC